ncbi:Uncharacterised protein [Mycobacterium tuberculosis]|nr:Uncharacterised protein [Mycobacterium tuberculosis]
MPSSAATSDIEIGSAMLLVMRLTMPLIWSTCASPSAPCAPCICTLDSSR